MFSDLPGHTTPNGGSVPIEILVTPLKPDITILDRRNKTFNIFELTCPLEGNIKTRNQQMVLFRILSSLNLEVSQVTPVSQVLQVWLVLESSKYNSFPILTING